MTAIQYSGQNDNVAITLGNIGLNESKATLTQNKGKPDKYIGAIDAKTIYIYGNYSYQVNKKGIIDSLRVEIPPLWKAEKLYKLAIKNKISEYSASIFIAQRFKDSEDYNVAKVYFEKAFKYKKEWEIQHNYANTLKELGEHERALAIYEEIQTKIQYTETVEYNIALVHYILKRLKSAKQKFGLIVAKESNSNQIKLKSFRMLGNINDDQGNAKEALDNYNKALAINNKDAALLYDLGIYYDNIKNIKKAKEYFKKTLVSDPNHYSAAKHLEAL